MIYTIAFFLKGNFQICDLKFAIRVVKKSKIGNRKSKIEFIVDNTGRHAWVGLRER